MNRLVVGILLPHRIRENVQCPQGSINQMPTDGMNVAIYLDNGSSTCISSDPS